MKLNDTPTPDQKQLAEILKRESFQAAENQWFTARVLHRLPAKRPRRVSRAAIALYAVAAIGCVLFWMWLANEQQQAGVITMRHIVYLAAIVMATLWTVAAPLADLIRKE